METKKTVTIVLESVEDAKTYAKGFYLALTFVEREDGNYDCTFTGSTDHVNQMLDFVS